MSAFALPDPYVSAQLSTFEFTPSAAVEASDLLAAGPAAVYHRLVRDVESESAVLAARRVLFGFLDGASTARRTVAEIAEWVGRVRDQVVATLEGLPEADPQTQEAVLRQRAPLSLLTGCWLDTLSQPATQPAVIVNRLFEHQFAWRGEGNPQRSLHHLRRRALEAAGVYLPEIGSVDFLRLAEARPLTALHGSFYLALAKLPANFLPEVVGVHYAVAAVGVDDILLGAAPVVREPELRAVLAEYLDMIADRPELLDRLAGAVDLALRLELEHAGMLAELAAWRGGLTVDAKVAEIIGKHAPFAGKQHRAVRISDRLLSEQLDDPDLDLAEFVRQFRASRQLKAREGGCRFLTALKLGGPMFGVFDEREAATFRAWAEAPPTERPEVSPNRVGDREAVVWTAALAAAAPADVVLREATAGDDRQFFHRLVNIENFPNTYPLARAHAARGLAEAEVLFEHGGDGVLTDASWFDYSAEALLARVDRIYWDKLVDPYEPLTEVPDRDEVVFGQKTFALGSMIDGAWAHRIGGLGRYTRLSDGMLYSIYADEMGRGDLRKNHITLIYQVLASLDVHVPHIRDTAFLQQDELPDHLYGFSLHQLSLSLFPDGLHEEILGYNLGIEMFGLGHMRMHEMQKLRRHRFDVAYEEAHLSIDNFSAGHARQSAEIIVGYLDEVARTAGADAVQERWRRIWRGYASFAYFVEHSLVRSLADREPADLVI